MSTTWYTADPHWSHRLVAGLRGFSSPEEHDTWLARVYAEHFRPGDLVFWLGDLTMRLPAAQATFRTIETQPEATHRLVYGNHDAGHPMHRKAHRYAGVYRRFATAEPFAQRRLSPLGPVALSHFPYDGDHTDADRYAQWRLPDLGLPLIHGHTHRPERLTTSRRGTPQVHVGIDAWGRPVSEQEIIRLIQAYGGSAGSTSAAGSPPGRTSRDRASGPLL